MCAGAGGGDDHDTSMDAGDLVTCQGPPPGPAPAATPPGSGGNIDVCLYPPSELSTSNLKPFSISEVTCRSKVPLPLPSTSTSQTSSLSPPTATVTTDCETGSDTDVVSPTTLDQQNNNYCTPACHKDKARWGNVEMAGNGEERSEHRPTTPQQQTKGETLGEVNSGPRGSGGGVSVLTDIEQMKKGWMRDSVGMVTVGDIQLLLSDPDKITIEYRIIESQCGNTEPEQQDGVRPQLLATLITTAVFQYDRRNISVAAPAQQATTTSSLTSTPRNISKLSPVITAELAAMAASHGHTTGKTSKRNKVTFTPSGAGKGAGMGGGKSVDLATPNTPLSGAHEPGVDLLSPHTPVMNSLTNLYTEGGTDTERGSVEHHYHQVDQDVAVEPIESGQSCDNNVDILAVAATCIHPSPNKPTQGWATAPVVPVAEVISNGMIVVPAASSSLVEQLPSPPTFVIPSGNLPVMVTAPTSAVFLPTTTTAVTGGKKQRKSKRKSSPQQKSVIRRVKPTKVGEVKDIGSTSRKRVSKFEDGEATYSRRHRSVKRELIPAKNNSSKVVKIPGNSGNSDGDNHSIERVSASCSIQNSKCSSVASMPTVSELLEFSVPGPDDLSRQDTSTGEEILGLALGECLENQVTTGIPLSTTDHSQAEGRNGGGCEHSSDVESDGDNTIFLYSDGGSIPTLSPFKTLMSQSDVVDVDDNSGAVSVPFSPTRHHHHTPEPAVIHNIHHDSGNSLLDRLVQITSEDPKAIDCMLTENTSDLASKFVALAEASKFEDLTTT